MSQVTGFLPRGFAWAAVTAGIKASGRPDVALAVADVGTTGAALYTRNRVVAAPVTVGQQNLLATGGRVRAVVVNAGNANCATGDVGLQSARETCTHLAELVGCDAAEVVPSSTGIIGVPLPIEKLVDALPRAVSMLGTRVGDAEAFSTAILTTDTRMKVAQAVVEVGGTEVRFFGCCKGAGMIGPDLGQPASPPHATMLVYLFTDLRVESAELRGLLASMVAATFNSISVDGDTSTNDTVLLLASGASGAEWANATQQEKGAIRAELGRLCGVLAYSIIDDGEGVTHVVTLQVSGAATDEAAKQVARTIANSPLCKTAWSSGDPNWGRIVAAAGRAGVPFSTGDLSVWIAGLPVFERGMRSPVMDEAAVHKRMLERHYEIALELGNGPGQCKFVTCDLTPEYVHINADYST